MLITLFSLFIFSSAWAQTPPTLGGELEKEARATVEILKNRKDDPSILKKIYQVTIAKKKKDPTFSGLIKDCEVFTDCKKGNVLLFRGQVGMLSLPGISGLIRSHWGQNSYTQNKTFVEIMKKVEDDIFPLREVLSAPSEESGDDYNRLLLIHSKQDGLNTWWGERDARTDDEGLPVPPSREVYDIGHSRGTKSDPYLSSKKILFTFHANAVYLFAEAEGDKGAKQKILLDPLISFSSSVNQAMVFAVGNPQEDEAHTTGQLIVISVPAKEISSLCQPELSPKMVFETKKCSDYLNQHEDEDEYDVVGFIKPSHIRGSFLVDWKNFKNEMKKANN
ncbi:MAG: hypothetical protein ACOYL6_15955 [Bacteriovoracaceae bacterium]